MLMKSHLDILIILISLAITTHCTSQSNPENNSSGILGGPCEGCEAIYEYGDKVLDPVDTLPGFQKNDPKLKITGTIYEMDGKTPAAGVILYIYHTNRNGIYETKGNETGWARRHGHIRGWIKTGPDGKYTFYTFRPAAYPGRNAPEHIHPTIKEPGKKEYYIDEYVFDDDPLLTPEKKRGLPNRGGSGVVHPVKEGGIWMVQRDIILGQNIPHYE